MRATLQEVLGRAEAPQVLFGVFGLAMLVIIWGTAVHLIDVESNTAKNAAGQSTRDLIATYEAQMLRNLGTTFKLTESPFMRWTQAESPFDDLPSFVIFVDPPQKSSQLHEH